MHFHQSFPDVVRIIPNVAYAEFRLRESQREIQRHLRTDMRRRSGDLGDNNEPDLMDLGDRYFELTKILLTSD
jgi:hypothetical protein